MKAVLSLLLLIAATNAEQSGLTLRPPIGWEYDKPQGDAVLRLRRGDSTFAVVPLKERLQDVHLRERITADRERLLQKDQRVGRVTVLRISGGSGYALDYGPADDETDIGYFLLGDKPYSFQARRVGLPTVFRLTSSLRDASASGNLSEKPLPEERPLRSRPPAAERPKKPSRMPVLDGRLNVPSVPGWSFQEQQKGRVSIQAPAFSFDVREGLSEQQMKTGQIETLAEGLLGKQGSEIMASGACMGQPMRSQKLDNGWSAYYREYACESKNGVMTTLSAAFSTEKGLYGLVALYRDAKERALILDWLGRAEAP